jgi:nondiscriminating aspartyl-tRNA synthetase
MTTTDNYYFELTRNFKPIEIGNSLHIYHEIYHIGNEKITLYWTINSKNYEPEEVIVEPWNDDNPKVRTLISELNQKIGDKVLIKGWVSQWRDLKKMSFLILRDMSGYCQVIVPKDLCRSLLVESVVEIVGEVKETNQSNNFSLEIFAQNLNIISESEVLPFPISREEDIPPFNTLNLYRPLTLRKEKERCIFKIQAEVISSFRDFLNKKGFTEIQSTKISAAGLEGGADMFTVDYFGTPMYLTQSPQFYKQTMVGVFERVFEVGKVYRAEGSNTNKHLSEFIGLDLEMGFIDSVFDIMDIEEEILNFIFYRIYENCSKELKYLNIDFKPQNDKYLYFNSTPGIILPNIPRISYNQLFSILEESGEFRLYAHMYSNGINSEIEKWIGDYTKAKYNSDFVFIYGYPLNEKPFYTMPSNETILNEGKEFLTESFDLIYKGTEITSGGMRINNYNQLVESIKSKGLNPDNFESYLMPFKYGMPPHGGFGIGLERLLKCILNLQTADEASLIPRTKEKFIH